jgi:hypothetical protein
MGTMKLNKGTISLLVIIMLSSVLLFFFISFDGLARIYSINKIILKEQKRHFLLRDLLEFAIELTLSSDIKYPVEISWDNYSGAVDYDPEDSILNVILKSNSGIVSSITCKVVRVGKDKLVIEQAQFQNI